MTHVPNPAKLPLSAPMAPGFTKLIVVGVKVSVPISDSVLPGAIGTACAEVARVMSPATTTPAKKFVFIKRLLMDLFTHQHISCHVSYSVQLQPFSGSASDRGGG